MMGLDPQQIPDELEKIAQDMMAGFQKYFSTRRERSMDSARLFRDLRACFQNIHDLVKKNEESHRRSDEIHVYAQTLSEIITEEMVPSIGSIVTRLKEFQDVEHLNGILNNLPDKDAKIDKFALAAKLFDKMANMLEKGFKF